MTTQNKQSIEDSNYIYDVIIIGGGCAGYTAGIYSGRANLNTLLIEGLTSGGQLVKSHHVENYPGFEDGISGEELMTRMKNQAHKFVKNMIENDPVIHIHKEQSNTSNNDNDNLINKFKFRVDLLSNTSYYSKSIIIATGANAKRLNIPGENTFWLNGVSACAVCDGPLPFYRNKPLAVIGGGDTALEEALYLSKFASHVYIIHRNENFKASKILMNRAKNNKKIEFITNTIVNEVKGDLFLEKLSLQNVLTKKLTSLNVNGMFYGIGHTPNTSFLFYNNTPFINLDNEGYIICYNNSTQTSQEGIFSAGDVHDKKYRQAITASASGCMAALDVEKWLIAQS